MYYEKVELIPRMQGWFKIRKLIDIIHRIRRTQGETPESSRQTQERKKALDKIQHRS